MEKAKVTNIIKILKKGGIGVLPTDTIYGLVGRAEDKKAVVRIKRLKKRSADKPFIILISSLKDLEKFKIKLNGEDKKILLKIWPGPVSVAFSPKLSFRWPKNKLLAEIIKKTGPLVAPSANPEGLAPSSTITEAKNYFGPEVDPAKYGVNFYLSAKKKLTGQPSTLISLKNGPPAQASKIEILRQGRVKINLNKLWKI